MTDQLANGNKTILLKVNNRRPEDGVPGFAYDWWNYGGLTREVYLIEVPRTFVRNYSLHLDEDRRTISGWVVVDDADDETTSQVRVLIPELAIAESVDVGADGRGVFSFRPKQIDLWSPESPRLYRVAVETERDRVEDRIGFRTIDVRGRDIC